MGTTKARWKPAPKDQRRVASGRTAPKARFTRRQRSGSLPPSLPSGRAGHGWSPLLKLVAALVVTAGMGVLIVIGVGTVIHAEQHYQDSQQRASYYGLPTQPFATLAPDSGEDVMAATVPSVSSSAVSSSVVSSSVTALPNVVEPVVSESASGAALSEPDGATGGDQTTLASSCDKFGIPVSIRIFDWNDWSTVELSNPLVAQLPIQWDASADIWRGYQVAKSFDQPDDARERWKLQLFTADGVERRIQVEQSASTPDTLYVYAFQILTPYADAQGKHYGYHPCRAFRIPAMDMDVLLSAAGAYQSSGSRFPAFAAPDDARWVRGSATPLDGSFDLRSIPTPQNNEPLQSISQVAPCYFITEDDWGVWAQIRIGNTTAWIDTSTVRLDTAP